MTLSMSIERIDVTAKELAENYIDNEEDGVTAYGGKLDVRPAYQREFVYKDKQRDEVIRTVLKGFPLNVMYWAVRNDGTFEVIDGQQRTISICRYIQGNFSVDFGNGKPMYFHSLPADQREKINKYPLTIYKCSGDDSQKLEWFETINIAGEELTKQELRNAVYSGTWITDAKKHFSRSNGGATKLYGDYLNGVVNRQMYLETAIKWIADRDNLSLEQYMAQHQKDEDASELWQYFQEVFAWVSRTFSNDNPERKKLMKGLDWGILYNQYKDEKYNSKQFEDRIKELIDDDEVKAPKGIYPYLITGNDKHLILRSFTDKDRQKMYQIQNGVCPACTKTFELSQMDADHIIPWSQGGKTVIENCQMLCKPCNRYKSDK